MGKLRVGEVYRYSKALDPEVPRVDGFPNFLHVASNEAFPKPLLERGISPLSGSSSRSRPAVLISSSPYKAGSSDNPWHDIFDLPRGLVTYFGDSKGQSNPTLSRGNATLIDEFARHKSGDVSVREGAAPLLLFERVSVAGKQKGFIRFRGLGVIREAELVMQFNSSIGFFPNFKFTFGLLSLDGYGGELDWDWITARRAGKSEEATKLAPQQWIDWARSGYELGH